MRCETARRFMMERLYETLPPDKDRMLETHIQSCQVCASEWKDVQAAHSFMKHLPEKTVPLHLQQAILQQSQLEALPPESESWTRSWPKWAAAAVLIACLSVTYSLWDGRPVKPSTDAALVHPNLNTLALNKLNGFQKNSEEQKTDYTSISSPDQENVPAISLQTSRENKSVPSIQPAVVVPADPNEQDTEQLFRTGLRLYNNAFTKTGDDQKTLLNSAILLLDDLEKRHPDQGSWIAMGMILKADSYRVLNETEKAISIYRQMAERFADQHPYCEQARASRIKLMLKSDDFIEETEEQLIQFENLQPPPAEYALLALSFSKKVVSTHPEKALGWTQRAMNSLPERHPIREKAVQQYREIEEAVREKFYIQDWKVIGPFPLETLPEFDFRKSEFDVLSSLIQKAKNPESIQLVQRKPNGNPIIDIAELLKQPPTNTCAFAQTYIYSPTDRVIHFQLGYTDGLRVWLNGEPLFSSVRSRNFRLDRNTMNAPLKEGWNQLFLKCYRTRDIEEWKFSLLPTDTNGLFIPELKFDSLYRPNANSE